MALQSPINAFRVESKAPDGTLKSGLKRAPFPIAFYNVYRERERRACDMRVPTLYPHLLPLYILILLFLVRFLLSTNEKKKTRFTGYRLVRKVYGFSSASFFFF